MKILFSLALLLSVHFSIGQTIIQRDPAIDKIVKQVSSDSLKAYVAKMVSFGTRHTISSQTGKAKGIGAAQI